MNLAKMTLLTEADDLFDIDKEVDAQIKRVENRIARNTEPENQPEEPPINDQQQDNQENLQDENNPEEMDNSNQINDQENQQQNNQSEELPLDNTNDSEGGYEYMNSEPTEDVPDDYEVKQTIPELKILNTLSDSEYQLCNIKILEDFKELRRNVDSTINNILMTINTKNAKQRQVINIVHNNLYEMLEDIDNYILYRNKDVYEENVVAYLTYLKRYRIATNLIKIIVDENLKSDKDTK